MIKKRLAYLLFISVLSACNHNENTNLSPLQKLEEGNKRFASGKSQHPNATFERIQELKAGQHPFAVILSCSDYRVPAELLFDQGFGDIFSIRTAGNVIGDYELGSLEYAIEHLDCKLIVVMGHKDCGAVKAFINSKGHYEHRDHIKNIINYIEKENEQKRISNIDKLSLDKAIDANIAHGVAFLKTDKAVLKERFDKKELQIVGALYNIESGKVTFKNIK